MQNERMFIAKVEAADTEEFAEMLFKADADEERALKAYLGEERYRRMRSLVLKQSVTRGLSNKLGNIVILPGIMGSNLSQLHADGTFEQLWLNIPRLAFGAVERLRLAEDGRAGFDPAWDVRPTGLMKRAYGELLLFLRGNWNVYPVWYDWRKDLMLAATHLESQISQLFADDAPVHIVAHSMGGLVARTFIKKYPERWNAMQGPNKDGGKLIMLGTPNHGSFAIPQVITGIEKLIKMVELLDLRHNRRQLLEVLNSFLGTYQMLPTHLKLANSNQEMDDMSPLYKSETYGGFDVPQSFLDKAKSHHVWLQDAIDIDRMVYIAGTNRPTFCNINSWSKFVSGNEDEMQSAYDVTFYGDGRVTHDLGRLVAPGVGAVPTYYIEEDHGDLASNEEVFLAIEELLVEGEPQRLQSQPFAARGDGGQEIRQEMKQEREKELEEFGNLARRNSARGAMLDAPDYISDDERRMEELLTRGVLISRDDEELKTEIEKSIAMPTDPATITIRLVYGEIESVHTKRNEPPIDAVAVGLYNGVKPYGLEKVFDREISKALPCKQRSPDCDDPDESDLILTQYTQRGTLRADLAQTFFMDDPRPDGQTKDKRRVIAVAGMGEPGRFGEPEVSVMARELCWSLGRMGKRHLATDLIGIERSSMTPQVLVVGWIRGIKNAVTGSIEDEGRHLKQITFVVRNGSYMREINNALIEQWHYHVSRRRLNIIYDPVSEEDIALCEKQALEQERKRLLRELDAKHKGGGRDGAGVESNGLAAVTFSQTGNVYTFGATTQGASVPERDIMLDVNLVRQSNDELAADRNFKSQYDRGQFMWELLIPDELGSQMSTSGPLVMLLDTSTARIHWELMAQPERAVSSQGNTTQGERDLEGSLEPDRIEMLRSYLGLSRSLTRRLRSTFAPPPDAPPPPQRRLRVLVVADPAQDAPLANAQAEGVQVADLFESYNEVYKRISPNRIEVVRLIGPYEATRTNVLRHLMVRSYDVLHFAGHCVYKEGDSSASGWLFNKEKNELLTANELKRIDRIPKFIFSNACESGVTIDRSDARSVGLAPNFAEQFFQRGVSNFVCTAWPVDDFSARQFALTLYSHLLGIELPKDVEVKDKGNYEQTYKRLDRTRAMYDAMREARWSIADTPYGALTWGAYQHYGDPYLRFFDASQYDETGTKYPPPNEDSATRIGGGEVAGGGLYSPNGEPEADDETAKKKQTVGKAKISARTKASKGE